MSSHITRWISVAAAAAFLDLTVEALRRDLERHARRAPDGGVEAEIDGVRGRKLGRRWRVSFHPAWGTPSEMRQTEDVVGRTPR